MMFMNPFRKKKEEIYEILLPGEKSQAEQPFTSSAKQTVVNNNKQQENTEQMNK